MKITDLVDRDGGYILDAVEKNPVFEKLRNTPHSKRWHKEGDPLVHTLIACDKLHQLMTEYEYGDTHSDRDVMILMCAMLCHDLGKAETTYWDNGQEDYCCKNHGAVGAKIVRELLFDEDITDRERVCRLVRWHMSLHHILDKADMRDEIVRLSKGYAEDSFFELWLMTLADALSSRNDVETAESIREKFWKIREYAVKLGCFDTQFETEPMEKEIDKCPVLNVMIGLPGAGKDTFINSQLMSEACVVLSRDEIRKEIGLKGDKPQGTKTQEAKVSRIFDDRLAKAVKAGKTVWISNTNLLRKYRNGYLQTLEHCKPFVVNYYYVEPPSMLADCIERRKGQIEAHVIEDMWQRFEFPDPSECDNLFFIKQRK